MSHLLDVSSHQSTSEDSLETHNAISLLLEVPSARESSPGRLDLDGSLLLSQLLEPLSSNVGSEEGLGGDDGLAGV